MSALNTDALQWSELGQQPGDVRKLAVNEREALIISATRVGREWVILSRYRDMTWRLEGFTSNVPDGVREIDFSRVPIEFIPVMKSVMYRYLRRGRAGQKRPSASTLRNVFENSLPFLRHVSTFKIDHFGAITPMVCANYVSECRAIRQTRRSKGKPLSVSALERRFMAVEALYELSQYTHDPIPRNPWPDTSASAMSGRRSRGEEAGKTPLLPDDVFCTLFEKAHEQVRRGNALLDIQDDLERVSAERNGQVTRNIQEAKNRRLVALGWAGGLGEFNQAIQSVNGQLN